MRQNQFDATVAEVERELAGTLSLRALSLSIAAPTFAGLPSRIAEYST